MRYSMREEMDHFGTVLLDEQILYGIQTARAIENMTFSGKVLAHYPAYTRALMQVKKAAALTNVYTGDISHSIGQAIVTSCDLILEGHYQEQFQIDPFHGGGGIGTNMNSNEVLANLANLSVGGRAGDYSPVHPIEHVNLNQSTSDVCHTAIRLAIVSEFSSLSEALVRLINALHEKQLQFRNYPTLARTCLQDALETTMGDTFSGYSAVLTRRLQALHSSILPLHSVNLGATVIGSGEGATDSYREHVLHYLKLVTTKDLHHSDNFYDAAQNLDQLGEFAGALEQLASSLLKIAKDLRLLSSGPEGGFGELRLPSLQAGSSFFPGKVNPIIPETLIQCCFKVIGSATTVRLAVEHGELNLNVYEGSAGVTVLDMIGMLEKALTHFTERCITGIEVNPERCIELTNATIPLVIKLKNQVGYRQASRLVKELSKSDLQNYVNNGGVHHGTNNECRLL